MAYDTLREPIDNWSAGPGTVLLEVTSESQLDEPQLAADDVEDVQVGCDRETAARPVRGRMHSVETWDRPSWSVGPSTR